VLKNILRNDDTIARVGGDEFAILTPIGGTDAVRALCGRLTSVLAREGIGMSFGWGVHPRDGSDPLTLFRAADERLHAQKLIRSRLTGGQIVELPTDATGGFSLSSVPR
jgi:GGDEF domain-containing protein